MQNGANDELLFIDTNCPQLTCVVIDDPNANNDNILVDPNTTLVGSVEECDLSIHDSMLENTVSIYPNPVNDKLFISLLNDLKNFKVSIFNMDGKEIISIQEGDFKNRSIDVQNLTSGIYFIQIKDNQGQTYTQKFVKM